MKKFFIFIKSIGLDKLSRVPIVIKTSKKLGPLELRNFFRAGLISFVVEILK
jgi:hypothetical protein